MQLLQPAPLTQYIDGAVSTLLGVVMLATTLRVVRWYVDMTMTWFERIGFDYSNSLQLLTTYAVWLMMAIGFLVMGVAQLTGHLPELPSTPA